MPRYSSVVNIVTVNGSLRTDGLHAKALERLNAELTSVDVELSAVSIRSFPLYDPRDETPECVADADRLIRAADGVVIACPEYNYSVTGALKNAIDWLSRPAYAGALAGQYVAIFSVSPSIVGGARGQGHLKQILLGLGAHIFPYPEVTIGRAHEAFAAPTPEHPALLSLSQFGSAFVASLR